MPISKMADRWGKRRIFLIGVALFCCSSLSVYFVSSIPALLLIRVLQGHGQRLHICYEYGYYFTGDQSPAPRSCHGIYHSCRILWPVIGPCSGRILFVLLELADYFLFYCSGLCHRFFCTYGLKRRWIVNACIGGVDNCFERSVLFCMVS